MVDTTTPFNLKGFVMTEFRETDIFSINDKGGFTEKYRHIVYSDELEETSDLIVDKTFNNTLELISDFPYAYDTVADMQADTSLHEGDVCHTLGFHAAGDGGAAWYTISDTGTANGMDVIACGDLFANLVIECNTAILEQFGAYGNSSHDDTAVLNYANETGLNIYGAKEYYVDKPVFSGTGKRIEINKIHLLNSDSVVTFQNCAKFDVDIIEIAGQQYAIDIVANSGAVQLNNFRILAVFATQKCVSFKYTTGVNEWINENVFDIRLLNTGSSRLGYGFAVESQIAAVTSSLFNRNVFVNCDFENVKYGIVAESGSYVSSCVFDNLRCLEIPSNCFMIKGNGGTMRQCIFRPKTQIKWNQIIDSSSTFGTAEYTDRNTVDCMIATSGGRTIAKSAFFTYGNSLLTLSYNVDTAASVYLSSDIDLTGVKAPLEYKLAYLSSNVTITLDPALYNYNGLAYLPICFQKTSASATQVTLVIGTETKTLSISGVANYNTFSIVIFRGSVVTVANGIAIMCA